MSLMRSEATSAPERVADMLARDTALYADLAAALRARDPALLATVARGSSDCVAGYAAWLAGARMGMLTASVPPSLVTLYGAKLRGRSAAALSVSQSGASPDIVAATQALRDGGALSLVIVNKVESPLARAAEWVLPAHAGDENSVAATKSVIASMAAVARLIAAWSRDTGLTEALARLPDALAVAARADWSPALDAFAAADRGMVIGRGAGLSAAQEAALKFKETCLIQAEAFSAAEVRHGPFALIQPGYPVLLVAPGDATQASILELATRLDTLGARVLVAAPTGTAGAALDLPPPLHPALDPLIFLQAFYVFVEQVAQRRSLDPDTPRNLAKVTRTV